MLVQDLMTAQPLTARRTTPVKEAITTLAHRGITSLPVVDDQGRLIGIVSEADLIRDVIEPDPRAHLSAPGAPTVGQAAQVGEVMTPHVLTTRAADDVGGAVDLMTATGAKSLPVVDDDGCLVGVLSRSDVVAALARPDETLRQEVDALLLAMGHDDWLVESVEGRVRIEGPTDAAGRRLARATASTVVGVISVEVG